MVCFKAASVGAVALSVLLLVGCSKQMQYAQLIDEAEQAQAQAASVGGEWRDTQIFIDQAKKAAAKAEFEEAVRLAERAKFESAAGYQQAVSQQGKINIPSYLQPQPQRED